MSAGRRDCGKGGLRLPEDASAAQGTRRASGQLRDRRSVQRARTPTAGSDRRFGSTTSTRAPNARSRATFGSAGCNRTAFVGSATTPAFTFRSMPRATPRRGRFRPTSCSSERRRGSAAVSGRAAVDSTAAPGSVRWLLGSPAASLPPPRARTRHRPRATVWRSAVRRSRSVCCAPPTGIGTRCDHSRFRRVELFCARERTDEHEELFREGTDAVFFSSPDELQESGDTLSRRRRRPHSDCRGRLSCRDARQAHLCRSDRRDGGIGRCVMPPTSRKVNQPV